jgi:hypothetical protein
MSLCSKSCCLQISFRVRALWRFINPYKIWSPFIHLTLSSITLLLTLFQLCGPFFCSSILVSIRPLHSVFSVVTACTQCKFPKAYLTWSWVGPICTLGLSCLYNFILIDTHRPELGAKTLVLQSILEDYIVLWLHNKTWNPTDLSKVIKSSKISGLCSLICKMGK